MSFRRGRGRSFGRGGNFRGGRSSYEDAGPPQQVVELGHFTHACLEQIVCKSTTEKLPFFNAPVFFENKTQVGKVDDIFGAVRNHSVSVTLADGFKASSFEIGDKIFIDPYKLLPLERFLPGAPPPPRGGRSRGRYQGGGRGGWRGGSFDRGGRRGGSFDRGGGRGRFNNDHRGRGFDRGQRFDRGGGHRGSPGSRGGGRFDNSHDDRKRTFDSGASSTPKKFKFQ